MLGKIIFLVLLIGGAVIFFILLKVNGGIKVTRKTRTCEYDGKVLTEFYSHALSLTSGRCLSQSTTVYLDGNVIDCSFDSVITSLELQGINVDVKYQSDVEVI